MPFYLYIFSMCNLFPTVQVLLVIIAYVKLQYSYSITGLFVLMIMCVSMQDKKRHALNLGDDPEAQNFLESKLNKVNVKTSALESTSSIVARNIPPYDASAATPGEVYPLEKIIEKGEWNFLEDIYWLLQEETGAATDAYPVFVRNRLDKLRDIKVTF